MHLAEHPTRFALTSELRDMLEQSARRAASPPPQQRQDLQTHAFFELYAELPLRERQARSLAYAMVNEPVIVFPDDRLHGVFYGGGDPQLGGTGPWEAYCSVADGRRREAAENPEMLPFHDPGGSFIISTGAFPGHIAWNYHDVLEIGVDGLIERHRQALADTRDMVAAEYYRGVIILLEAVLTWNDRHVAALRELLSSARDPQARQRLTESIDLLERVPAQPARTFLEALQSFYFIWLAVMYEVPYGGNSPGRLDYFLWPYLQREYADGSLDREQVTHLLCELFIKIDERVHASDGHVNTIVVGGVAPDGSDAVNPLSWMMLDAFEALPLTHPAVYTRVSSRNPPEYLARCVDYLVNGGNRAQILADEAIITAMMQDHAMPFEDAAMYMCGGCMEIAPHGLNSDLLFAFLYNVPKTVELLVTGGTCLITGKPRLEMPGSLRDYPDFPAFYAACVDEIRRVLHAKFRTLDIYSETMAHWRPAFLQSSMTGDCLLRGRSQQDGGARYADYGGTPLGLQNAADALYAIKRAVFDDHICTADQLMAALTANFVGHDALRRRLLAIPKFGEGDPGAEAMMAQLLADLCHVFDSYTNRHGGRVKPIIFTFVWAPEMGRNLGASADGRLAGEPIGHGLTPQRLGSRRGLTTAIDASTQIPLHLVRGGASTMWDMDAASLRTDLLQAIVQAFINRGGQIFQGNTSDVAELERALLSPADYPNLIVRVGGFSARFINLNPQLQQEIVQRHRHLTR